VADVPKLVSLPSPPAGILNASNRGNIINSVGLFQAGRRPSNKIKKGGNIMTNGNRDFEANGGALPRALALAP